MERHRDDDLRERLRKLEERARPARKRSAHAPGVLEELEGVVEREGVLVVERDVGRLLSRRAQSDLIERTQEARAALEGRDDIDADVRRLLLNPDGALFMDTETTGLGAAMVFLLGVMRVTDSGITLRQVFARDYREEPELLGRWASMLGAAEMLVTFNGKSYDMPVLRDRMGLHGLDGPSEPPHLDLLHASRRRWSGVFPDCRLQTLEWKVCGRRRAGDIPGEEIPAAYHHFVRTGDPRDMLNVFHHNALDLVTLADIAVALSMPREDLRRRRA
ncbi:MAG: ribonuclease H-like domain-containing protein [Candidatus Eisenbacteria bacterium]